VKYDTGTITVVAGSNVITGVGTSWLSEEWLRDLAMPKFIGVPYYTVAYRILRVVSNTELRISRGFRALPGGIEGASALEYAISAEFAAYNNIPLMRQHDTDKAGLTNRALKIIAAAIGELD